jgi:Zn-dependent protease
MLLVLLRLPIQFLWIAFYALCGLLDVLRGRTQLRTEATVLINAPRGIVWTACTADHLVFEGPPVIAIETEMLPGSDQLQMACVSINGQLQNRTVARLLERDAVKGTLLYQIVPHELSMPPDCCSGCLQGVMVEERPEGTALTLFGELTVRSFRERIVLPLGTRRSAQLFKQHCEKEAGTQSRLAAIANHGLVLSSLGFLSFWYLLGLQAGLVLALIVALHEAGHALAMRMVGVEVRGVYLIPFFGGAAIPKTSYRSRGRLGFVALMGPAFSLIPTLGFAAAYPATGEIGFLGVAGTFAFINAFNLLPIYPMDGGLILSALLGSRGQNFERAIGWSGVLAGLGAGLYWQSFIVGFPFVLFAVQRYFRGNRILELEPLSAAGGTALALGFVITLSLHAVVFAKSTIVPVVQAASALTAPDEVVLYLHSDLRSTDFVQPLLCTLRRVLAAPVSTRTLRLPLGPEVAANAMQLDAKKVGDRFIRATAQDGSRRTFKHLLLGDDLRMGRLNLYARSFIDEKPPELGGIVSTAQLRQGDSRASGDKAPDVTAMRTYKLIMHQIAMVAGFRNPQGCILKVVQGGPDEIDRTSAEFCDWDRSVLVRAGILKAQPDAGCPLVSQAATSADARVSAGAH